MTTTSVARAKRDAITVMQVFRAKGIVPTPSQSWSVGSRVAAKYRETFGDDPPKDNRPKTSGRGTHCFALYPPKWRDYIEKTIDDVVEQEALQMDIFHE